MNLITMFTSGGFVMYPLLLCSILVWAVIFERIWRYRRLQEDLAAFHLQAMNTVLRGDQAALRSLCAEQPELPTARLLSVALERMSSKSATLREHWQEAMERKRQVINQELRQNLWLLGTIGSSAPFIGLFGTVVGVLQSFQNIASTGKGGFPIVAAGISEALIATSAGIVVAVIAVMAFNAFQIKWSGLVLMIRVQIEEIAEVLQNGESGAVKGGR